MDWKNIIIVDFMLLNWVGPLYDIKKKSKHDSTIELIIL